LEVPVFLAFIRLTTTSRDGGGRPAWRVALAPLAG
jgi:hypothetical protein